VSGNWCDTLGVFDLETTGVDVEVSRIVSATVAVIDSAGACATRQDWLADPGVEIPASASAVHGITTERARREGRAPLEVVSEIVAALRALFARGLAVVVYNAPYDLTLLNREARRHGVEPLHRPAPIIDPLVIDRAVDRYRKGKRTLEVTAREYGVPLVDAHDAGADAIAAGRVAQAIARRHPAEVGTDAHLLHERQILWCKEQAASFQDYMRRVKDPSFVAVGTWPER
jgi:DNA polymerase-3 subunit epsilon